MIGRAIGHFEITAKLGQGGMGEVYRARDTRLNRDVALKLLPREFANDDQRMKRFSREAQLLASLNHPNIAAVYGLETRDSGPGTAAMSCLVMELVEGEDLSERIARGPLPLDQALPIALQITEALENAHEKGIIHRDLKPANIKLTPEGRVKVLDFGLAKALEDPMSSSQAEAGLSLSPTLSLAATQAGIILGTAAYMAPEQAQGKPTDRRADIWAFGTVLYEMLTGGVAFRGESIADTMASVLKLEPDFEKLPSGTPTEVRRLLRRCLQKDPNRRLHDVADVRIEIDEVDLNPQADSEGEGTVSGQLSGSYRSRHLPLFVTTGLGVVAGAMLWSLLQDSPNSNTLFPNPVRRSSILVPEGKPFNRGIGIDVAPDGSALAFAIGLDDQSMLHLRQLDSSEIEVIPGTEGASTPFFSPDGEQVAFIAGGQLKTVSLRGGGRDVTVLCDAPASRSGTWDSSGWVYFNFGESRLARVRQEGGNSEELGNAGSVSQMQALPDGRGILLTVQGAAAPSIRKDTSTIAVLVTDGMTVKPVVEGGYSPRYLPSGHLVFMRSGGLFAIPFDLDHLEAKPPAVSVQPNVSTDSIWGTANYDVTSDGTLIYVAGGDYARTIPTWIDLETGAAEKLSVPADIYNTFDLSPDGTQLAIQNAGGSQDQVYVFDTQRGTLRRLTLDGSNFHPVWSYDGREVFFVSAREGKYRLFRQPVDGSAPPRPLLLEQDEAAVMGTDIFWPSSVTPDGKFLMVSSWAHPTQGGDLWQVPLDGAGEPKPILATEANEIIPQISPDGKWLAYLSDRGGPYRILVRPFPDVERREWAVSGEDGYDPRWSPRGDALLYRQGWGKIMRVPVGSGSGHEFSLGVATTLIETDFHDSAGSSFALSADGKRVLVNKPVGASLLRESSISLVTGWAGEVSRLMGSK